MVPNLAKKNLRRSFHKKGSHASCIPLWIVCTRWNSTYLDSVEALICLQDWFRASAGPNINVSSVNGISYSDNFVNLDLEDSMDWGSL